MVVPVVVLSSIDPVLRDLVSFSAVADGPATAVLRQDLDPVAGTIRRVVSDASGVVDERVIELEHTCLGCAIREDSLPALGAMAASERWQQIVWALPVGAETPPAARPLADPDTAGWLDVELAAVLAVVDSETVEHDLLGDDLLDERGLALALDDRRAVGEALAAQVRHADLVLTSGSDLVGTALLDHLRGTGSRRLDLLETPAGSMLRRRYVHEVAEARIDPRLPGPADAISAAGVWSVTLESRRPLHPERFMDRLGELVAGNTVSHGCFQLATRPDQVGQWDGVGGQLSIGHGGGWDGRPRRTRLRFIGTGPRPVTLRASFEAMALTDDEWSSSRAFVGRDDGLDPWLGEPEPAR